MAAKDRRIEDYDRVLVVEGYGDLLFYAEVLEAVGKHDKVYIKELGGKHGLRQKLEAFITPALLARKAAMAFVIDADEKPEITRQTLESLLSDVTKQNVVEGAWTSGTPRIGLMVVPGGATKGEIETLVWQSWSSDPANHAQKKCVEEYVACMNANGAKAQSPDKGLIGALLAVRNDDDPRLGPSARSKQVFDLGRTELQPLRDFLAGF